MKYKALGTNVLVRTLPEGNVTGAGIILIGEGILKTHPDAVVLSAPTGSKIKDGSKVKYVRGSFESLESQNGTITIVREKDIISEI